MNWFQLILFDENLKNPYISNSENLGNFDDWQFKQAVPITGWTEANWIKCNNPECNGTPNDALQNHLALPIYSRRLQVALGESGITGIQFLPIRVLRHDEAEVPGYAIANILNRVPALDVQQSDHDRYEDDCLIPERRGRVAGIRRPVLIKRLLQGLHLIRLDEFPVGIYVSGHFKRVFEFGGFSGHVFREVHLS